MKNERVALPRGPRFYLQMRAAICARHRFFPPPPSRALFQSSLGPMPKGTFDPRKEREKALWKRGRKKMEQVRERAENVNEIPFRFSHLAAGYTAAAACVLPPDTPFNIYARPRSAHRLYTYICI